MKPFNVTSALTNSEVAAVDDYGNLSLAGGVQLAANPNPEPTPAGTVQLYSPNGTSIALRLPDGSTGGLTVDDVTVAGDLTVTGIATFLGYLGAGGNAGIGTAGVSAVTIDGASIVMNGVPMPPGMFLASDHGYETWSGDPAGVQGGSPLTNGTQFFQKLHIRRPFTPANVHFSISAAAVTPTAGQNWVGIYSSAGTRLAQASLDAAVLTTGVQSIPITPGALAAGSFVWVALLGNASTPVQVHRYTTSASPPNAGLAAATLRSAVNGTAKTALDASITPGSNTGTNAIASWCALS